MSPPYKEKKKSEWYMGKYDASELDIEAMLWCIRNKIYVAPLAKSPGEWYIDITLNGKVNRSPNIYVRDQIWEKIYEIYRYYYEKYFQDSK